MKKQKFISDYEQACAKIGEPTTLPDVSTIRPKLRKHTIATHKLSIITEANNDGVEMDLGNTDQTKYYPWFWVKKKAKESGFGLSFGDCGYSYARTVLGVRLACASTDQARFQGENCTELYLDLLS